MPADMSDDNTTPADAPAHATAEAAPPEGERAAEPHPMTALPAPEEHVALAAHAEEPTAQTAAEPEVTEAHAEVVAEPAPEAEFESAEAVREESPPAVEDQVVETDSGEAEGVAEIATAEEPEPAVEEEEVAATTEEEEAAEPEAEAVEEGEPAPATAVAEPPPESKKKWYVVKIQSGREDSIKAAIERKVKIEGLEEFYGQIAIPVEEVVEKKKVKAKVKDKKTGEVDTVYQEKNVVKKRKKFPGYLFAEVEFNDRILYLFRETSGVGDFVGAAGPMKPPAPMNEREVQQMLTGIVDKSQAAGGRKVKVKLDFEKGDKVRIREGAFSGMEGEVKNITEAKDATETPKVTVVVTIFGHPVDVELDYWQVDKA